MELLAGQRQYASKSPYVFLTPRPKNMLRLLHRMGRKETVHGFRSSFRDWCAARSDFGDFTAAELCLAHTVKSATVRAYLRTDLLDKRREIMNAWEAYCVRSL